MEDAEGLEASGKNLPVEVVKEGNQVETEFNE
jgi:hypothetical protein